MQNLLTERRKELEANLTQVLEMLAKLESALLVTPDPTLATHYTAEIERLRSQAKNLMQELQQLSPTQANTVGVTIKALSTTTTSSATTSLTLDEAISPSAATPPRRLPYSGCKLYFSGPGDQYAFLASLGEESKPRDIVTLRDTMIDNLVRSGFSVVRDRNLPEYQRPFDPGKVRYLIATCDGICCLCYPKDFDAASHSYHTSPLIIEEIKYALEANLSHIVVFVEEMVKDPTLEELLGKHAARIQRRTIGTSALKNLSYLQEQLFQPWELIQPHDHSVFVTIPFDKQYDGIFELVRDEVHEICNLDCRRSKDTALGTTVEEVAVYRAIMAKIQRTPFVLMVLADERPNCYFEAGVAAAYNRPAIRIVRDSEVIPFNVQQHWPVILVQPDDTSTTTSLTQLRSDLRRELSRFAREEVSCYSPSTS